jgi:2-methylaconitate cis-trans-isomerase PrpF
VADGVAAMTGSGRESVVIEHPSGKIEVSLITRSEGFEMIVERAGIVRTARLLFSGYVYVPAHLCKTKAP